MPEITRRRVGQFLRRIFELLWDEPDGLPAKDVLAAVPKSIPLTDFESGYYPSTPNATRFEKIVRFATIDLVKRQAQDRSTPMREASSAVDWPLPAPPKRSGAGSRAPSIPNLQSPVPSLYSPLFSRMATIPSPSALPPCKRIVNLPSALLEYTGR